MQPFLWGIGIVVLVRSSHPHRIHTYIHHLNTLTGRDALQYANAMQQEGFEEQMRENGGVMCVGSSSFEMP